MLCYKRHVQLSVNLTNNPLPQLFCAQLNATQSIQAFNTAFHQSSWLGWQRLRHPFAKILNHWTNQMLPVPKIIQIPSLRMLFYFSFAWCLLDNFYFSCCGYLIVENQLSTIFWNTSVKSYRRANLSANH